jgi:hypothetical protein
MDGADTTGGAAARTLVQSRTRKTFENIEKIRSQTEEKDALAGVSGGETVCHYDHTWLMFLVGFNRLYIT